MVSRRSDGGFPERENGDGRGWGRDERSVGKCSDRRVKEKRYARASDCVESREMRMVGPIRLPRGEELAKGRGEWEECARRGIRIDGLVTTAQQNGVWNRIKGCSNRRENHSGRDIAGLVFIQQGGCVQWKQEMGAVLWHVMITLEKCCLESGCARARWGLITRHPSWLLRNTSHTTQFWFVSHLVTLIITYNLYSNQSNLI